MGGLPFKRTAKRKTAETTVQNDKPAEDDPLNMFQLRQDKVWFTEREKQATEKAVRQEMQAMKQRLAEEDQDIENQLSREASRHRPVSNKGKQRESERRGSKRQHLSISSSDDDEPKLKSPVSRKSPRHDTKSPSRTRDSVPKKSGPLTSRSSQRSSVLPPATQIISLDDSSDDYTRTPTKSKGKEKMTVLSDDDDAISAPARHESDNDDVIEPGSDAVPPAEDDLGAAYIREAQERARKRREEQEARESREAAPAEIIIESRLEGIPNLRIKIQIDKKITLIRDAWQASTKHRLETMHSDIKPNVVDRMFLTWKSTRILEFYTLERLGISPDRKGNLYPTSSSLQDGFKGWNKVHFEAWTEDLFKKFQDERERERKRNLGELDYELDNVVDSQPQPPAEPKIKIFLRSKDYEQQRYSVQAGYTIGKVVKTFRQVAKVPADKIVKIHFDGQILGEDETIADLDLEDMDVLEVHVKDS